VCSSDLERKEKKAKKEGKEGKERKGKEEEEEEEEEDTAKKERLIVQALWELFLLSCCILWTWWNIQIELFLLSCDLGK